MHAPVLTFFNNKGGAGKTSLVYRLAWMFSKMETRVLVCDLDPQANLTARFLDDERLNRVLSDSSDESKTIYQCVKPLTQAGGLANASLVQVGQNLSLIPGDIALSEFEEILWRSWTEALGSDPSQSFRILTVFWTVLQASAREIDASIILVDSGPYPSAINRSALLATDFVIIPLGADLISLNGLHSLGATLNRWRNEWRSRVDHWVSPKFPLPEGKMESIGYLVQQPALHLKRPIRVCDRWFNRIPETYARAVLGTLSEQFPESPRKDINCLGILKHYRSLVLLAEDARKPIFDLTIADGAIGGHSAAVYGAYRDFYGLASMIGSRASIGQFKR